MPLPPVKGTKEGEKRPPFLGLSSSSPSSLPSHPALTFRHFSSGIQEPYSRLAFGLYRHLLLRELEAAQDEGELGRRRPPRTRVSRADFLLPSATFARWAGWKKEARGTAFQHELTAALPVPVLCSFAIMSVLSVYVPTFLVLPDVAHATRA